MKLLPLLINTTFSLWIALAPSLLYGYTYECFSRGNFTSVHVLTVDPKEHIIVPVKAHGEVVERETVANLAIRHKAIAAINGGFWRANGAPAGILKINSLWYGTPSKPRGAIGWSLDGQKVLIDQVLTNYSLLDCPEGEELEVIPLSTSSEDWKTLEHIVGGVPVLVRGKALVEDYSPEGALDTFLTKKHSRTAVGIKKSGEWVLVVVDGRLLGLLGGITIRELSKLMLELGCVDALNLDGGSSSTMFLEGAVINESYGRIWENGKLVQAVSDAILISDRKERLIQKRLLSKEKYAKKRVNARDVVQQGLPKEGGIMIKKLLLCGAVLSLPLHAHDSPPECDSINPSIGYFSEAPCGYEPYPGVAYENSFTTTQTVTAVVVGTAVIALIAVALTNTPGGNSHCH